MVQHNRINEVFIIEADHANIAIEKMIQSCQSIGVHFRMVPKLLQVSVDRVDIGEINGVPLIGERVASIRRLSAIV